MPAKVLLVKDLDKSDNPLGYFGGTDGERVSMLLYIKLSLHVCRVGTSHIFIEVFGTNVVKEFRKISKLSR